MVAHLIRATLAIGLGLAAALVSSAARPEAARTLTLSQSIELRSVQGRLDHLSFDSEGSRLFVAALAADSLEVVDLRAATRITRIEHLNEPQGVLYLAQGRRLFVAEGAGARVQVFVDGKPAAAVAGLDDADNLRFDPDTGRVYVGYGSALAVLDPNATRTVGRFDLPGHPEGFELATTGPQIYVNVPSRRQIAVIDRRSGKIAATWDIGDAAENFPMALDEPQHRLFVATRRPAMLLVYDTRSGRRTSQLPICADADDLFFDRQRGRLYVVCGEGAVDVVRQQDADHYSLIERVRTARGARTGLLVPGLATLFVAVPARRSAPAEIRAYKLE